jgi:hypothetical protein
MFQSSDKLVLRYQLTGKVKPIPAPVADPSDPSGATALDKVPVQMGTFYTVKTLAAKIDSAEFFNGAINNRQARKGSRYLAIQGTLKNDLIVPQSVGWSTVRPKLMDYDGGEIRWNGSPLYASRDDTLNTKLEPGKEVRFRWFFEVPQAASLASLSVTQSGGREYIYDLTSVQ